MVLIVLRPNLLLRPNLDRLASLIVLPVPTAYVRITFSQ